MIPILHSRQNPKGMLKTNGKLGKLDLSNRKQTSLKNTDWIRKKSDWIRKKSLRFSFFSLA